MIPLPQAQSLKIEHIGIGVFDGVHRGHQEIIATVLKQSSDPQSCALLTFDPHPLEVISLKKPPHDLALLVVCTIGFNSLGFLTFC